MDSVAAVDVFAWLDSPSPSEAALVAMQDVVGAAESSLSKTHDPDRFIATDPDGADWKLGVKMWVARLWRRKGSPEGIISFDELATIRVTRVDPDIDSMLVNYRRWI